MTITTCFTNCKKEINGVDGQVKEFGNDECSYAIFLDNAIDEKSIFIPINLPEELQSYKNLRVSLSFKKTGDFCECIYYNGSSPEPGVELQAYEYEKIEIIEIEEL